MTMPYGSGQFPYAPQNPPQPNSAPGWGGQYPTQQPGQGYVPQPPQLPPQQFPQQGQPQQQPQYQQQPQAPVQPQQGIDLNQRIPHGDTRWPQELWGKTLADAQRYYMIMRQDFIQRNPAQGQQQMAQQQQPQNYGQPYQQQLNPTQQQLNQQQQRPADPIQRAVAQALEAALPQYLAPIMAPIQQNAQVQARQTVAQRYRDWNQYDAQIQAELANATPEQLANPAVWEGIYFLVRGRATAQSQQAPQGQQAPQNSNVPQQQFQGQQPIYYGPAPQQQNYFTEGPTPPAPAMDPNNGGANADPMDEVWARRFGIPVEVYRAGKGQRGQQGGSNWPVPPVPQMAPANGNQPVNNGRGF